MTQLQFVSTRVRQVEQARQDDLKLTPHKVLKNPKSASATASASALLLETISTGLKDTHKDIFQVSNNSSGLCEQLRCSQS